MINMNRKLHGINEQPLKFICAEAVQRECNAAMYEYKDAPVVKSIVLQQGDTYCLTTGILRRAKL